MTGPRFCALLLPLTAACVSEERPAIDVFRPDYLGIIEAEMLADDLLRVVVEMEGARDSRDVLEYAECAMAGEALEGGFRFARQVRTQVSERGGVRRADAVYSVSISVPRGLRTVDAEPAVADCDARGIPTR